MRHIPRASKIILGCTASFLGFFALAGQVAGQNCVNPPSGIVSWWPGDGNANDITDGNNGTIGGMVTFAPGLVGQAFQFNGGGVVDTGNATNLHVSAGEFTVEAWVYYTSFLNSDSGICVPEGCDMSIVDKMAAGGINADGWRLLKQAHNYFLFCLGGPNNKCANPANGVSVSSPLGSVAPLTWYHVVVVKASSTPSLYVNGAMVNQNALGTFVDTNSTYLLIGANLVEGAHANGLIDEVTLYNRALGAAEISAIFAAGSSGKCKFTPASISIKPGSSPPTINLGSAGVVPVAILSSPTFDARQVDPGTVTLAGASVRLLGSSDKYSCSVQDVNGDQLLDLVCQVKTAQMFIQPGDSVVVLEAKTFGGQAIRGQQSIRIVP